MVCVRGVCVWSVRVVWFFEKISLDFTPPSSLGVVLLGFLFLLVVLSSSHSFGKWCFLFLPCGWCSFLLLVLLPGAAFLHILGMVLLFLASTVVVHPPP